MIATQCLTTILVAWFCPMIVVAQPFLYVKNHIENSKMVAEDTVHKKLETPPDTRTSKSESFRRTTQTKENLISPQGDKITGETGVHRSYDNNEQEFVSHKTDAVQQTKDKVTNKHTAVKMHRQIDGKDNRYVYDEEASTDDSATGKRQVLKTSYGGVVSEKGKRTFNKINLSRLDSLVESGNAVDVGSLQQGHITHVEQKKSSTVSVHNSDPNNLVIAGDEEKDTTAYRDDYVSNDQHTEQKMSNGVLSSSNHVVEVRKMDELSHEHGTTSYHETPLHKFQVEDDEVQHGVLGHFSKTENRQTEFKGNDGSTEDIEEKRKQLVETDRAEHMDTLKVQSVSKSFPQSPLIVTMKTRITDRDHYALEETASGRKQVKTKNGGTQTIEVQEEHKKTYNMDAIPQSQVDSY